MTHPAKLVTPRFLPPLDADFRPAALADRAFEKRVRKEGGGVPLVFGLERGDGSLSRYETAVLAGGDGPAAAASLAYAERTCKFLLWQRGAWRVYVGGPAPIAAGLWQIYSPGGARAFDYQFMGEDVYDRAFTLVPCRPDDVPAERESGHPLGRHLDGCRIGFDLGASDLKVAAVVDGRPVFSEEVVWDPGVQSDPGYHYTALMGALRRAASRMPRVDAIGGSSAGVYVDNRPRIASLFRGVPKERYGEVRTLFTRIRDEMGVPLEVINDGEVTALAGSMSLGESGVLGLALGSSEAAGYVTPDGSLTGWLNELAFAPIDYRPDAPADEWSDDRGCGAQYLSQQCVFRLAPRAGIALPADAPRAARLEVAQRALEAGHEGAIQIWESMGDYLGYAIAHYARFYTLRHVLILGRCTSGSGGPLLLERARAVLDGEFPEVAGGVQLHLPDETSRRVGQSIAAASLPAVGEG
jgi:predicted NBD/HSP70 family sugar kinase